MAVTVPDVPENVKYSRDCAPLAAERLLRGHPEAGIAYATHRAGIVRRILLGDTKYHLYYRYRADHDELLVLSVWSAVRERGPKL